MRLAVAILVGLALALPACSSLPDGSRAVSAERAAEVLRGAADDVALSDLNGDGLVQLDRDSGAPIAAVQALLRGQAESLLSRDANGDGLLDSRELIGASAVMAARILAARESLGARPAQGSRGELVVLGLLLADRLSAELR